MNTPKPLIVGGVVAGPLFAVAWLVEDALTEGYDPLRHLISALVLGELGWL